MQVTSDFTTNNEERVNLQQVKSEFAVGNNPRVSSFETSNERRVNLQMWQNKCNKWKGASEKQRIKVDSFHSSYSLVANRRVDWNSRREEGEGLENFPNINELKVTKIAYF